MEIFIVQDNRVAITPQALLLSPFKEMWEKYEPEDCIILFGYIEFMCSHKKSNPFIGYPINERPFKILETSFPNGSDEQKQGLMNNPWVKKGMEVYKKIQHGASPSIRFYEASVSAAEKMIDFFTTFDLSATNPRTGTLLYKPADITRTLKDVNDVIKTMAALKEKVLMEIAEDARGKGNRDINYFEKAVKDR
jgi:hypothetical protein